MSTTRIKLRGGRCAEDTPQTCGCDAPSRSRREKRCSSARSTSDSLMYCWSRASCRFFATKCPQSTSMPSSVWAQRVGMSMSALTIRHLPAANAQAPRCQRGAAWAAKEQQRTLWQSALAGLDGRGRARRRVARVVVRCVDVFRSAAVTRDVAVKIPLTTREVCQQRSAGKHQAPQRDKGLNV